MLPSQYMFRYIYLYFLEAKREKIRQEGLPFFMFLLGIFFSILSAEFFTVLRIGFREDDNFFWKIYFGIIVVGAPMTLVQITYYIYKDFIKPMNEYDRKIDAIKLRKN